MESLASFETAMKSNHHFRRFDDTTYYRKVHSNTYEFMEKVRCSYGTITYSFAVYLDHYSLDNIVTVCTSCSDYNLSAEDVLRWKQNENPIYTLLIAHCFFLYYKKDLHK
jgi:hypothetical protein